MQITANPKARDAIRAAHQERSRVFGDFLNRVFRKTPTT